VSENAANIIERDNEIAAINSDVSECDIECNNNIKCNNRTKNKQSESAIRIKPTATKKENDQFHGCYWSSPLFT